MSLEWNEQYSVHTAQVARVGRLVVAWSSMSAKDSPKGYEVSAFGVRLKALSPDAEHGKARAVVLARKLLANAMMALPPEAPGASGLTGESA